MSYRVASARNASRRDFDPFSVKRTKSIGNLFGVKQLVREPLYSVFCQK